MHVCVYICVCVYIYIYIYIYIYTLPDSEKGEVLPRGVGTLRCFVPPNASVHRQPDDMAIHAKKLFLGAGFL